MLLSRLDRAGGTRNGHLPEGERTGMLRSMVPDRNTEQAVATRLKLPRYARFLFGLGVLLLLGACVPTTRDMVAAGTVTPQDFEVRLPIQTYRGTVLVTAAAQGIGGRFVLDTGAAFTVLDRMPLPGKRLEVRSASGAEVTMTAAPVATLRLGAVEFRDTYAASGDLATLAELIPDFLGLLGQAVLHKASWLIDYGRGEMLLRSDPSPPPGFEEVSIHYRGGLPYVVLDIDGTTVEALLDSGASTYLALPRQSPMAQRLREVYPFREQAKTLLSIDGVRSDTQSVATLPRLGIGASVRHDVPVELRDIERPRLGARFLAAQGRVFLQGGGSLWLAPAMPKLAPPK